MSIESHQKSERGQCEPDTQVLAGAVQQILARVRRIEQAVATLTEQQTLQEWYDTHTAAEILSKSAYTVREWCRLGRIRAEKRSCGRGASKEWMISHAELMRVKSEGLLPERRLQ